MTTGYLSSLHSLYIYTSTGTIITIYIRNPPKPQLGEGLN